MTHLLVLQPVVRQEIPRHLQYAMRTPLHSTSSTIQFSASRTNACGRQAHCHGGHLDHCVLCAQDCNLGLGQAPWVAEHVAQLPRQHEAPHGGVCGVREAVATREDPHVARQAAHAAPAELAQRRLRRPCTRPRLLRGLEGTAHVSRTIFLQDHHACGAAARGYTSACSTGARSSGHMNAHGHMNRLRRCVAGCPVLCCRSGPHP